MQVFYVDSLPAKATQHLIDNIQQLIAVARDLDIPIIYSVAKPSLTFSDRGLLADFHGMGMKDDAALYLIDPRVAPSVTDHTVTKQIYSAFFRTDLESIMRTLNRDTLLIAGIYASIGCQLTAFDAFMRGIRPFYIADAMLAYTEAEHIESARYVGRLCAAVHTTKVVIEQLFSPSEPSSQLFESDLASATAKEH
jgi:bifunctional isochorismate lyase/aryl carrier protein